MAVEGSQVTMPECYSVCDTVLYSSDFCGLPYLAAVIWLMKRLSYKVT